MAEPRLSRFRFGGEQLIVISNAMTPPELPDSLTPAEREVAILVLSGASNADVARIRGTAERTVANQLASIFRKAGVQSRTALHLWNRSTE